VSVADRFCQYLKIARLLRMGDRRRGHGATVIALLVLLGLPACTILSSHWVEERRVDFELSVFDDREGALHITTSELHTITAVEIFGRDVNDQRIEMWRLEGATTSMTRGPLGLDLVYGKVPEGLREITAARKLQALQSYAVFVSGLDRDGKPRRGGVAMAMDDDGGVEMDCTSIDECDRWILSTVSD
jgi:hypothetical protein